MRGLPELVPSIASVSVRIELSFKDYCFHFSICELLWNHSSAVWKCYKLYNQLVSCHWFQNPPKSLLIKDVGCDRELVHTPSK